MHIYTKYLYIKLFIWLLDTVEG